MSGEGRVASPFRLGRGPRCRPDAGDRPIPDVEHLCPAPAGIVERDRSRKLALWGAKGRVKVRFQIAGQLLLLAQRCLKGADKEGGETDRSQGPGHRVHVGS